MSEILYVVCLLASGICSEPMTLGEAIALADQKTLCPEGALCVYPSPFTIQRITQLPEPWVLKDE